MKTKLTLVVPELLPVPPVNGGAVEQWVQTFANQLDANQYDITIVSRPSGESEAKGIHYKGIPWTKTERVFHSLKNKCSWRNPIRYVAKIQNVAAYGKRLSPLLTDSDVVVIHNEPNLLMFFKKRPGQRVILHMHNDHLVHTPFMALYRHLLKQVDAVVCVSAYIRQQAIKVYPEFEDKFTVMYNVVDADEFKPYPFEQCQQMARLIGYDKKNRYFMYVGRLTAVKGVDVLVNAFTQLVKRYPEAKLLIVGSSFFAKAQVTNYQKQLVSLAAPIKDNIIFTGFIHQNLLKYLYCLVDAVVVPSVWQDPCPLVVLEGMAAETCVVASAVGGIPELVNHQENGFLVPANDIPALLQTLETVMTETALCTQVKKQARETICEDYTWPRLILQFETLLNTLSSGQ